MGRVDEGSHLERQRPLTPSIFYILQQILSPICELNIWQVQTFLWICTQCKQQAWCMKKRIKWKLRGGSDVKAQRPSAWCCATFLLCWHHHGTIELGLEKRPFSLFTWRPGLPLLAINAGQSTPESLLFIALPPIIMKAIEHGGGQMRGIPGILIKSRLQESKAKDLFLSTILPQLTVVPACNLNWS